MTKIERKLIVNEISLKNFLTYTYSVYDVGEKINKLERISNRNLKVGARPKTKASTGAKMIMLSCLCNHNSINELNVTTHGKNTSLKNFFSKKEYIPKTHGLRDCVIETDYNQLVDINNYVVNKAKENKFFKKNLVDGLSVCAWDGVELCETSKEIDNLPEREHENGEIKKYIKYLCAMNVGSRANIMIATKQMTEKEKALTKSGKQKAKTFGETTAMLEMIPIVEEKIGRVIDVHVMDALYLNKNIMEAINKRNEYFVIRMEDDTKLIYKDAKGLFDKSKAKNEYEVVEIIEEISVKYSKKAKHKDYSKTKIIQKERQVTDKKIGEKIYVTTSKSTKKNSIKTIKTYERVIKKVKTWDDEFEFSTYDGTVRVVRSVEKYCHEGKEKEQEIYIATNMLNHSVRTIIKIMHLRWNIENCGFRKLKQQYNLEHIFIGEFNAINYIFQMIILVSNLLELYFKIRLKIAMKYTYIMLKKIFEKEIQITERIGDYLMGIP